MHGDEASNIYQDNLRQNYLLLTGFLLQSLNLLNGQHSPYLGNAENTKNHNEGALGIPVGRVDFLDNGDDGHARCAHQGS